MVLGPVAFRLNDTATAARDQGLGFGVLAAEVALVRHMLLDSDARPCETSAASGHRKSSMPSRRTGAVTVGIRCRQYVII